MYACFHGHSGAVKAFLNEGADADFRNMAGRTALQLAQKAGFEDAAKAILDGPNIMVRDGMYCVVLVVLCCVLLCGIVVWCNVMCCDVVLYGVMLWCGVMDPSICIFIYGISLLLFSILLILFESNFLL